jgi:hypothetical protein
MSVGPVNLDFSPIFVAGSLDGHGVVPARDLGQADDSFNAVHDEVTSHFIRFLFGFDQLKASFTY